MLRRLTYIMALMAGFALVALLILRLTPYWDRILAPPPVEMVDFQKLDAPATPNWYLLCPAAYCPTGLPQDISPVFDKSEERLRRAVLTKIGSLPSVSVRLQDGNHFEFVDRTPWLRWPDLISVRVIAAGDNRSTIAIYSRSVYGSWDYGANRKRVSRWLSRLED